MAERVVVSDMEKAKVDEVLGSSPSTTYRSVNLLQAIFQESDSAVSIEDDVAKNKALVRKQDIRIVPLSAGIYLLCYLDRSNIGSFSRVDDKSSILRPQVYFYLIPVRG